jgi:hypothetical protein
MATIEAQEQPGTASRGLAVLARSAAEVATLAATGVLAAVGTLQPVVPLGLVLMRFVGGVGKAIWEGARPEVVAFGGDAAATFLGALRRWLRISPR